MADDVVAKARALRPVLEPALRKGRREFAVSSALGLVLSAAGFALLGFVAYFLLVYATARWERADGSPFSVRRSETPWAT
ncbi:MAG: hypothetical protein MUC63_01615 [Planctomycetes bacterium]|nr:hypothetical protein [Planctomycetota bacterium]